MSINTSQLINHNNFLTRLADQILTKAVPQAVAYAQDPGCTQQCPRRRADCYPCNLWCSPCGPTQGNCKGCQDKCYTVGGSYCFNVDVYYTTCC